MGLTVVGVRNALKKLTIDGFRLSVLTEREVPLMLDWSHVPRQCLQTDNATQRWCPSNDNCVHPVGGDSTTVELLVGGTLMPRFEYNAARARGCGAYITSSDWFSCWQVYYCLAVQRAAEAPAKTTAG